MKAREPQEASPSTRRAVFFDVENSSRAEHVSRMLQHLELGELGRETQLVAVGNWRVVGLDTARLLSRHGARLVHSAPAFGVKDWSDLRIAVAAGIWLGDSRPGDVLEVITDDQAFDAVGDVAASCGVSFRRLSYRSLVEAKQTRHAVGAPRARPRGGRRRGRASAARAAASVAPSSGASARASELSDAHAAPPDELLAVVHELLAGSGARAVSLDALSNALKSRGFRRPPGSPRLITRLRRIKDLAVSATGAIRLVEQGRGSEK